MSLFPAILRYTTSLALAVCGLLTAPCSLAREEASIDFQEAVAKYGPGLFPAITRLTRCGDYRVFVVYGNGTDMLFMDKLVATQNESTFAAEDGMSFEEFNSYEESTTIRDVSCGLVGPTKLRIVGKAHSFHSDKSFRFTIVVDTARRSHTYADTQPK